MWILLRTKTSAGIFSDIKKTRFSIQAWVLPGVVSLEVVHENEKGGSLTHVAVLATVINHQGGTFGYSNYAAAS